ncbi:MAG: hypothetical protein P1V18_03275 [Candidatus Gracilibacteria bacterium]|nr:hypothetical protein [Candidatus Gracilibacteria bacterium]
MSLDHRDGSLERNIELFFQQAENDPNTIAYENLCSILGQLTRHGEALMVRFRERFLDLFLDRYCELRSFLVHTDTFFSYDDLCKASEVERALVKFFGAKLYFFNALDLSRFLERVPELKLGGVKFRFPCPGEADDDAYFIDEPLIEKLSQHQLLTELPCPVRGDAPLAFFERLGQMKALEHLQLAPSTPLSQEKLDALHSLKKLQIFTLFGRGTVHISLDFLQNMESMVEMTFIDCFFPEGEFQKLAHMKLLKKFTLTGEFSVPDMSAFQGGGLEELRMHTPFNKRGFESLGEQPFLRVLDLEGATDVGDSCMDHITKMKQLEVLEIDFTSMTSRGLCQLPLLPELRKVTLGGLEFGPEVFHSLSKCKNLREVHLSGNPVSDRSLRRLLKLENLQILSGVPASSVSEELSREFGERRVQVVFSLSN